MLRIARAYVATAQSAEDAVQDAWLGVVRGLPRFQGRSSLRTWVFTILMSQARTRGAREARAVPLSDLGRDDGTGPTVDPDRFQGPGDPHPGGWKPTARPVSWPVTWEGQPEGRVLAGEALRLLESALTMLLPPRQRTVVTLRDVQDLTPAEACEVLGITEQTSTYYCTAAAPPSARLSRTTTAQSAVSGPGVGQAQENDDADPAALAADRRPGAGE